MPASSGKTTRHRLNRGGDRDLNSALWPITIVRLVHRPDHPCLVERRVSQGKTKAEAIRRIKRYLAREIYSVRPDLAAA